MIITNHAFVRWRQRFEKRIKGGIILEFKRAKKVKANQVRRLGVRVVSTRRYYVTELCIFVVESSNRTLITVLPRNCI